MNKNMKTGLWLAGYLTIAGVILALAAKAVYTVDPFFHYHKPDTDQYYYVLYNERSQNDGIIRHFDYDALITGTSMVENTKTSKIDEIFGVDSIKVAYAGGSFRETHDCIDKAIRCNPELKTVFRSVDMTELFQDPEKMRYDMGTYPTYLYDNNPFNDVKYLWNRDLVFDLVRHMIEESKYSEFYPGIDSFDSYGRWQDGFTFGRKSVLPEEITVSKTTGAEKWSDFTDGILTEQEKENIYRNFTSNFTSLAEENPDVTFYCFFTPYSAVWWKNLYEDGKLLHHLAGEKYIIELMLQYDNIRMYSFNGEPRLTTDLNQYKDPAHYSEWVNTLILQMMHDGRYLLTQDNYREYLEQTFELYSGFDYESLNTQEDWEEDLQGKVSLYRQLGIAAEPVDLLDENQKWSMKAASAADRSGVKTVDIQGVPGDFGEERTNEQLEGFYRDYQGVRIDVEDISPYEVISFEGIKNMDQAELEICIYNEEQDLIYYDRLGSDRLASQWKTYYQDVSDLQGKVSIVLHISNGEKIGQEKSVLSLRNIQLQ